MRRFFGKYRGKVENNVDPKQMGRIQVSVPSILGDGRLSWAMPCVPYAGNKVGFFAIPPISANVWVEFEAGHPDYPIWSGCFWGVNEVPVQPALATKKVWKTESITLTLDDGPGGGFTLAVEPPVVQVPLKLVCNAQGIEINCNPALIKLAASGIEMSNSPATVKISASGVELDTPPATVKLSSSNIELSNGGASVKLSPFSVSINDGALEVM
ncbi:phage baseplate assembly protein V [Nostoc sp. 106C]|uniref:phage baseplate assembly protein V n=1 Tax=Nostoc sp. 106C TaxID=1932667 RepID=UPI000A36C3BE|nr:phage baseplate assembly protein V [Nostoc sp. 106C]OUL31932.1 baseplate assembly protein [Nostoc sp. RF31YmG]OUL36288.1 baseplate assembly protein [Nostoc sp. 106C]